jgi:hypothetical protein
VRKPNRDSRQKDYKKGLDSDEARRKRDDGLNSIRKKKQQEQVRFLSISSLSSSLLRLRFFSLASRARVC